MFDVKQSTAATLIVGPILDSTGVEYTSAVIGDLSLNKNGTEAALASAATLTHVSNGHYTLVLTTGNTDTLGRASIRCNKSTYQMPVIALMVRPATVFDLLVTNAAGGANGFLLSDANNRVDIAKLLGTAWLTPGTAGTPDVNVKLIGGQTASLNANNLLKVSLNDILATALTESGAGRLAAAIKKFFDVATPLSTMELLTAVTTLTTYTGNTPQTGDAFGRLGVAGVGLTNLGDTRIANLDATVSSRGTSTLTQAQVSGGAYALNSSSFGFNAALPLTTQQKADVNAEADTALADAKAAYVLALEAAMLNEGDASALLAAIAAKVELFLINDGDASATLAAIATAVRTNLATELGRIDVATSTRLAPTTNGRTLDVDTLHKAPATIATGDIADVSAVRAAKIDNLDVVLSTRLASSSYTTPPTAAANAAAAAAQITADHGAGSYIRNTEPLDAAGTRNALGMAAADLDDHLNNIFTAADAASANTNQLPGMIEQSGGHDRFKDTALEEGPSGSVTLDPSDIADIADAVVDAIDIPSSAEIANALSGEEITVRSLFGGRTLTLYKGAEVSVANGNSVSWDFTTLPDLTDGEARLHVVVPKGAVLIDVELAIENPGTATQTLRFTISGTDADKVRPPEIYIGNILYKTAAAETFSVARTIPVSSMRL